MKTNTLSSNSSRSFNYHMKALYRALDVNMDDYYDDDYQESISFYYMGRNYAVIA